MSVPSGVILVWSGTNASIPAGWERETDLDDKFPKATADSVEPDVTGGSETHTHTSAAHGHTLNSHTHTYSLQEVSDAGGENPNGTLASAHAHDTATTSSIAGGSLIDETSDWQASSSEPPYYEVIFIKPSGGTASMATNIIAHANLTSEPSGWTYCDGGGTTPDLTEKYLKGATTDADSGGTGGGTSHSHVITHGHTPNSHTHSGTSAQNDHQDRERHSGGSGSYALSPHTHPVSLAATTGSVNSYTKTDAGSGDTVEVDYKKLGAIQYSSGGTVLGMIGLYLGTLASIPASWALCDGQDDTIDMRSKFAKIGANLSENKDTGGSNTHTHSSISHTHTATGTHTHVGSCAVNTSNAGQGGGSDGIVLSTHTHTVVSESSNTSVYASTSKDASTDSNEPAYRTVAYVEFTGGSGNSIFFGTNF